MFETLVGALPSQQGVTKAEEPRLPSNHGATAEPRLCPERMLLYRVETLHSPGRTHLSSVEQCHHPSVMETLEVRETGLGQKKNAGMVQTHSEQSDLDFHPGILPAAKKVRRGCNEASCSLNIKQASCRTQFVANSLF